MRINAFSSLKNTDAVFKTRAELSDYERKRLDNSTKREYFIKINTINTESFDPTFKGILYEAINKPRVGELVYTSTELKDLDTKGGPVCFEHDRKIGKIG